LESPWQFPTDAEPTAFCHKIAAELVARFGISKAEALGRINRDWRLRYCLGPHVYLAYHETPEYWAEEIYYGKDSCWWVAPEDRERLGLGPVQPEPYP
jgi:hypothetical protein